MLIVKAGETGKQITSARSDDHHGKLGSKRSLNVITIATKIKGVVKKQAVKVERTRRNGAIARAATMVRNKVMMLKRTTPKERNRTYTTIKSIKL